MYCRLTEEQFRPLLEAMLDNDRVKTEQMLKTIGEERMRFPSFILLLSPNFISCAEGLDGCLTSPRMVTMTLISVSAISRR